MDGRVRLAAFGRAMVGPARRPHARRTLDRASAQSCPDRFSSTAFGGLVDSGIAVGWLHHAAALTKRSFLGKAWLTVSTFDLTSPQARTDPLALHLVKALAKS
ncbi:MAG: hypothetical protein ACREDI_07150 [Roseiarcus sp.]